MTTPNICQACGKRKQSYPTRAAARQVARITRHRRIRVYPCGCYFHLTSATAERVAELRERTPAP